MLLKKRNWLITILLFINNNIMNNLVTTAISYTNGSPHIGHLYESVLSDFMKHLLIISDKNTKLLTGTDEHGQKVENSAKNGAVING